VAELARLGADLNAVEAETHNTALMIAAVRGYEWTVLELLRHGADPLKTYSRFTVAE